VEELINKMKLLKERTEIYKKMAITIINESNVEEYL